MGKFYLRSINNRFTRVLTFLMRNIRSEVWLIALLFLSLSLDLAFAGTKDFLCDNVNINAQLSAGGICQTWADGGPKEGDYHIVKGRILGKAPAILWPYLHAIPTRTSFNFLDNQWGLPISPVGATAKDGWAGDMFTKDKHDEINWANGQVVIGKIQTVPMNIFIRDPKDMFRIIPKIFNNYANIDLEFTAVAGVPKEGPPPKKPCPLHSADSCVAGEIEGSKVFTQLKDKKGSYAQREIAVGGARSGEGKGGWTRWGFEIDPMVLTLTDLTTGTQTSEALMDTSIFWRNSLYSITDTGIQFVIDRHDVKSFVDWSFNCMSPWVVDPYAYGMHVDNSGLTPSGIMTLDGWTLETTPDEITASYLFGPEGMPWDYVEGNPPDDLFTPGHNFRYDIFNESGSYMLAAPIPSTLFMLVSCFLGLPIIHLGRKRVKI